MEKELLQRVRELVGDEQAVIKGYTVYDGDGNYILTLENDKDGNAIA